MQLLYTIYDTIRFRVVGTINPKSFFFFTFSFFSIYKQVATNITIVGLFIISALTFGKSVKMNLYALVRHYNTTIIYRRERKKVTKVNKIKERKLKRKVIKRLFKQTRDSQE